jgi:hypothetical protein
MGDEKMSARRHLRFFPSKRGSSKTLSGTTLANGFGIKIVIGEVFESGLVPHPVESIEVM